MFGEVFNVVGYFFRVTSFRHRLGYDAPFTALEILLYIVLTSRAKVGMNMPDTIAMKAAIIAYSIKS